MIKMKIIPKEMISKIKIKYKKKILLIKTFKQPQQITNKHITNLLRIIISQMKIINNQTIILKANKNTLLKTCKIKLNKVMNQNQKLIISNMMIKINNKFQTRTIKIIIKKFNKIKDNQLNKDNKIYNTTNKKKETLKKLKRILTMEMRNKNKKTSWKISIKSKNQKEILK
jgi:hypothetical protein